MRERWRRWGFRVLVAALLLQAGYYVLFGGVYSVFDMRRMSAERETLVDRLDSLIARTDSLAQRADSLQKDPLAIEREAREEHGLIREGEVLVRFHARGERDTGQAGRGPDNDAAEEEGGS